MGQLTDLVNQARDARQKESAGQLINTVADLKEQFVLNNTLIDNLKIKIKDDVSNDIWDGLDIENLGKALQLKEAVKTRALNFRVQLLSMKEALTDTTHKTEIQIEIDGLSIS